MPLGIVWSPGWGFDTHFFEKLRSHFPGIPSVFLDRGYFGLAQDIQGIRGPNWIGIGHSLGFHRLLKLRLSGYVSLAGFSRFCRHMPNHAGTPVRTVDRMIQAYQMHPQGVLEDFYKRCNFPEIPPEIVNNEGLFEDLQSLKTLEDTALLQQISQPILNLAARDDQIVDEALTQEFFHQQRNGQLIFKDKGGHALGFREPEWCAQQIKKWIKKNVQGFESL